MDEVILNQPQSDAERYISQHTPLQRIMLKPVGLAKSESPYRIRTVRLAQPQAPSIQLTPSQDTGVKQPETVKLGTEGIEEKVKKEENLEEGLKKLEQKIFSSEMTSDGLKSINKNLIGDTIKTFISMTAIDSAMAGKLDMKDAIFNAVCAVIDGIQKGAVEDSFRAYLHRLSPEMRMYDEAVSRVIVFGVIYTLVTLGFGRTVRLQDVASYSVGVAVGNYIQNKIVPHT